MTVYRNPTRTGWRIFCDHPGCRNMYDVAASEPREARVKARQLGWTSQIRADGRPCAYRGAEDRCAAHPKPDVKAETISEIEHLTQWAQYRNVHQLVDKLGHKNPHWVYRLLEQAGRTDLVDLIRAETRRTATRWPTAPSRRASRDLQHA